LALDILSGGIIKLRKEDDIMNTKYLKLAREETRRRCLCIPSCSDYAIACLKRFPLIFSFFKIHKRLFKTCKGEMYLIDKPFKKYNYDKF
jgi:putative component of membrane protein insertase Oxa1/YidC/SpoIIIJ protein YidD